MTPVYPPTYTTHHISRRTPASRSTSALHPDFYHALLPHPRALTRAGTASQHQQRSISLFASDMTPLGVPPRLTDPFSHRDQIPNI
jgi:hypothetical protein